MAFAEKPGREEKKLMRDRIKNIIRNEKLEIVKHTEINDISFSILDVKYQLSHIHKDLELVLILQGSMFVHTANENFVAEPGRILVFDEYAPHEFFGQTELVRILKIQIKKSFCRNYFPILKQIRFYACREKEVCDRILVEELVEKVFFLGYNYYQSGFGFELECYSDLNAILYLLLQCFSYEILDEEQITGDMKGDARARRILEYVEENYNRKLTLSELAEREGLSVSYLSHFFKEKLNIAFQDLLVILRFEKAVQLLVQSDMKLIDICMESGFSESKYFTKYFEQIFHMKPKDFRRSMKVRLQDGTENVGDNELLYTDPEECLAILGQYFQYAGPH
ncbi:MAG: helix-turn-helix transcriptional regulator [Blautia sp.]|nr:helix-turn-helix transcriptional regulator [Blautia sp.]